MGLLLALGAVAAVEFVAESFVGFIPLVHMPYAYFLPLPLVATAVHAVRKKWRGAALNFGTAFALLYLANPTVRFEVETPTPSDLDVATFNVYDGRYGANALRDAVGEFNPKVLLLQETTLIQSDPNLAVVLQGYTLHHFHNISIASKLPIEIVEEIDLSRRLAAEFPRFAADPPHHQFIQIAKVRWEVRDITFVNLHASPIAYGGGLRRTLPRAFSLLGPKNEYRFALQKVVLDAIAKHEGPVVLGGDFNMPPMGRLYAGYRDRLRDSWREAGSGFGFTMLSWLPYARDDHLFASPDLKTVQARVGTKLGSDHFLYWARFRLAATSE